MLFAYIMYKQCLSEWKRAVHATQQTIVHLQSECGQYNNKCTFHVCCQNFLKLALMKIKVAKEHS